jgi:hypothetical protein
MDEVFLSWNVTNWVTVLVMVFLGFLIIAMGAQVWRNYSDKKASA